MFIQRGSTHQQERLVMGVGLTPMGYCFLGFFFMSCTCVRCENGSRRSGLSVVCRRWFGIPHYLRGALAEQEGLLEILCGE